MNFDEQKIVRHLKYALNPSLLVEDVVNAAICSIELLPGAGSRIEYQHNISKTPDGKIDYDSSYWDDTDLAAKGPKPVKTLKKLSGFNGNTVVVTIYDRATMSDAPDYTGERSASGEQLPGWAWLQKTDKSQVNVTTETEGEHGQNYEELGYMKLGYKPITFVLNWLKDLLGKFNSGTPKEQKIQHPKFKPGYYPAGYDIKTILYFDIPQPFDEYVEDQKIAFDKLISTAPHKPWFDVVGKPEWDEHGTWYIFAKIDEPGFQMDKEVKAQIDATKKKAKEKEDLGSLEQEKAFRTPTGAFNKEAFKDKWDLLIANIANIMSRSGLIKDDRKLSPYYISMAIEKLLKANDPVTYERFDPDNMKEPQAIELFGDPRGGGKTSGLASKLLSQIQADPKSLKLESAIRDVSNLLEDTVDDEVMIDAAISKMAQDNKVGFTRDELKRKMTDLNDDQVDIALYRLEKRGELINKGGKYQANQANQANQVNQANKINQAKTSSINPSVNPSVKPQVKPQVKL